MAQKNASGPFLRVAFLCLPQSVRGAIVNTDEAVIAAFSVYPTYTPGSQRIRWAEVDTQSAANTLVLINRQHV